MSRYIFFNNLLVIQAYSVKEKDRFAEPLYINYTCTTVILTLFQNWQTSIDFELQNVCITKFYYIKVSGIPSGNKSIKTI